MGMLVAVLTTIIDMQLASGGMNWELIIAGLVVGSVIGIIMAIKVEMTECRNLLHCSMGLAVQPRLSSRCLRHGNTSKTLTFRSRRDWNLRWSLLQRVSLHWLVG